MDRTEALRATRNGATAALVSGVLTLGIALFAMSTDANEALALWNDPWILADITLIFACAYGIYRHSRVAAVTMLVYFFGAKIAIGIGTGKAHGIVFALVFLYFFAKAAQGAIVFHRLERSENPHYRPAPKWVPWVFAPVALIVLCIFGLGLLSMSGIAPPYSVQRGPEVSAKFRAQLHEAGIIEPQESIEYFYSFGLASVLEGGSVLTDERVVLYFPENGTTAIIGLRFEEITSVELLEAGGVMSDAIYRVTGHDPGNWMHIPLAIDDRGDVKFIEALRAKIPVGHGNR
jgi:hypothetical protein